jgi:hypothetical protein
MPTRVSFASIARGLTIQRASCSSASRRARLASPAAWRSDGAADDLGAARYSALRRSAAGSSLTDRLLFAGAWLDLGMLVKLDGHITQLLWRAKEAERRAATTSDPVVRADKKQMAKRWPHLARSYEFIASLERFLLDIERAKASGHSDPPTPHWEAAAGASRPRTPDDRH